MCVVKDDLREIGWKKLLEKCDVEHPIVADIERKIGWQTLWETALALGLCHTSGLQALSRFLCHHGREMKPCPLYVTVSLVCPRLVFIATWDHVGSYDRQTIDVSLKPLPLLDHVLDVHGGRLRIGLTKSRARL